MGIREEEIMPERRKFLLSTVQSIGLAAAGGLVWSGFIGSGMSAPLTLRPPGALPEKDFLARCIKCGLCVEACPYKTLIMARPGDGRQTGTPYFLPRERPCYMCMDIPCAAACPTAALDKTLLTEKVETGKAKFNINMARMGLAVIDRDTCIAFSGIQCDACYRVCPRIDKAITVEYSRNERTGKHALMAPVVHSDLCTGCGLCEKACVTTKASIFILPRNIAMGESNSRYVKGWDAQDEERLKDAPEDVITKTPRSEKDPLEYLNKGEI